MITFDKLECAVRINTGTQTGTAFTLEVDAKQYLVSARHLFQNPTNACELRVWLFDRWHDLDVTLIGAGPSQFGSENDFVVFSCSEQISPFSLRANRGGFHISQDVYFLGYPYNNMTDGFWKPNLSFPLVKKAIVSGVVKAQTKPGLLLLDGHNNPGFSGGPVLGKSIEDGEIRAIGIISGYHTELERIEGSDTDLWVELNAGIIRAAPMAQVLDAIDVKPHGFPIQSGWDWHLSRFASDG